MNFNFEFYSPWLLLLFLVFVPLIILDLARKKPKGIKVPTTQAMRPAGGLGLVMAFLRFSKCLILSALIIAMARPRTFTITDDRDETKGLDIMLTVDVSLSMLAKDLDPDRLEALKKIAKNFVNQRPNDRIGLVAYSGEAYTKVPLTTDHQVVTDEISELSPTELQPGTAIGEGLVVAVNHLKESKAKSKIIILMTDGENNVTNATPPEIAAELAKNNGIKVYTIGIGSRGYALFPTATDIFGEIVFTEKETDLDENLLKEIANRTGGKYFRATSNDSLQEIYDDINSFEKSDIKTSKLYQYQEYFRTFLWIALAILLFDIFLRWFVYKILS
ncbi:VWA domain-containing protein [Soonwooa sp.]|uniref:vWA domain-containing protein n=1 Tax=Soonwooa sp. TaxID=1938592 RepID=UPI002638800D|nr:VWA domain-containing protein [Soonwooa sp.]